MKGGKSHVPEKNVVQISQDYKKFKISHAYKICALDVNFNSNFHTACGSILYRIHLKSNLIAENTWKWEI